MMPLSIFAPSLVEYQYQMNEYLSSELLLAKTVNNDEFVFTSSENGLLTSISNNEQTLFSISYNELGNISSILEANTSSLHTYSYNVQNKLIRESHPFLLKHYIYDYDQPIYKEVDDTIETRRIFESTTVGRAIDYKNELDRFLRLDNVYFGLFEDEITNSEIFALRTTKNRLLKFNPISAEYYPKMLGKYQNASYITTNEEENGLEIAYQMPTASHLSYSFGTCFYQPLFETSVRISSLICKLQLSNSLSVS